MNKFKNINQGKDTQLSTFCLGSSDELVELKASLIRLIRLWLVGEYSQRKINRGLNIKYGYFRGCRIGKALDELFILIKFNNPFLLINRPNDQQITYDEKCIAQLIFPACLSSKDELVIIKNFVPEKESEELVRLAKEVNLSLS